MTDKTERKEYPAYYCYVGKRLDKSKLVHHYFECDADGKRIDPKVEGTYYIASKFTYANRPHVGIIYCVKYSYEDRSKFWVEPDWVRYHTRHPEAAQYVLEHKAATAQHERIQLKVKEMNKDILDDLTIGEFRELRRGQTAKQRRYYLMILLEAIR